MGNREWNVMGAILWSVATAFSAWAMFDSEENTSPLYCAAFIGFFGSLFSAAHYWQKVLQRAD